MQHTFLILAQIAAGILWISSGHTFAAKSAALKRDVFALLHEAAAYNVTIQFQDAKLAVARVGTGIVNPGEYDKNGGPVPPNGPPTYAPNVTSSASPYPDLGQRHHPQRRQQQRGQRRLFRLVCSAGLRKPFNCPMLLEFDTGARGHLC